MMAWSRTPSRSSPRNVSSFAMVSASSVTGMQRKRCDSAWMARTIARRAQIADARGGSLVAVFGAVYDVMAEAWHAKTWCCKSLANVYYLPQIEEYFSDAKYIYLYRSGS